MHQGDGAIHFISPRFKTPTRTGQQENIFKGNMREETLNELVALQRSVRHGGGFLDAGPGGKTKNTLDAILKRGGGAGIRAEFKLGRDTVDLKKIGSVPVFEADQIQQQLLIVRPLERGVVAEPVAF